MDAHEEFFNELKRPYGPVEIPFDDTRDGEDETEDLSTQGVSGGGGATHPFQIVQVSGEDNKIKFRYGTVNATVPTIDTGTDDPLTFNIDDVNNPTLTLSGTATHYIYLKVTIDASFVINTVEIESATTAPTNTTTAAHQVIATITTDAGVITAINQNWLTNAAYFYAGDDKHIFFI